MPSNTLYYFAVGGTGALSVEPLLMLCASGIGPSRLAIMLIDADAANPAFARAQELIRQYQSVRQAFGNPSEGFFRTELIRTGPGELAWSPLGSGGASDSGNVTLERFIESECMTGECSDAATLLDLLFSVDQRKERLREGFRGNPAIGSILMHGIKESVFFRQFLNSAKGDTSAAFFVAGSIFGGTGASALPVLAEVLSGAGIAVANIGAALVTPYYSLGEPGQRERQDGRLKPSSAVFLRNTAAALPTYTRGSSRYGSLYVVGDEQSLPQPRRVYSAGGDSQRNDPHMVELYAALAAIDFAGREHDPGAPTRMFYTTVGQAQPTWNDLPLPDDARMQLRTFLVASNFFLQYFGPARSGTGRQDVIAELRTQAWLSDLSLNPEFVETSNGQLDRLWAYCASVWGYLRAVSENYVSLRLVSFAEGTDRTIRTPEHYARAEEETEFALPRVDKCLWSFAPRQRPKIMGVFGKGGEDRLGSLAEMFHWYNQVASNGQGGLEGLLWYLDEGTRKFVNDWYTATI